MTLPFVYANVEFQKNEREYFKRVESNTRSVSNPNGILKLDWYITDNHTVSGTYIQNEEEIDRVYYENPVDSDDESIAYTGQHGEETTRYTSHSRRMMRFHDNLINKIKMM